MIGARLMVLLAAVLAGCGTQLQTVRVAVPVPCHVEIPPRPLMPTEGLASTASLDAIVQAALAELERREAYELVLVAALQACAAPL